MQKILVMGLPGSGKTFIAERIKNQLTYLNKSVKWFNADEVRKQFDDWDFSPKGRTRQAIRMRTLAEDNHDYDFVICDFVAPYESLRDIFSADWVIWMDTIDQGRFEDTNSIFTPPDYFDFRVTEKNADFWAPKISLDIANGIRKPTFDDRKETVQMLGRWQPWHKGHRALFERAIEKTGQVCIMIRDCQGWNGSNPFSANDAAKFIARDLDPIYQGRYKIMIVPNIVNITYGRDVGYKIEQEVFDDEIHSISATKIRKEMGLK